MRHSRKSEESDLLPERTEIDETVGRRTDTPIYCVDGLCIAIVRLTDTLENVALDLGEEMSARQACGGSLLFGPQFEHDLSMDERRRLANLGISIRRAEIDDLQLTAKNMLENYWRMRVLVRKQLLALDDQVVVSES